MKGIYWIAIAAFFGFLMLTFICLGGLSNYLYCIGAIISFIIGGVAIYYAIQEGKYGNYGGGYNDRYSSSSSSYDDYF